MTTSEDRDLYKDTPVRYLGYANEVGESLRGFIGAKWVRASYGLATLYVLADTCDKTRKAFLDNKASEDRLKKTIFATTDTLIWQMLASVFIPGYTINRVCAFSDYMLLRTKLVKNNRKMIVTSVGLAVIPFIIKPIDHLVDVILDSSLRKIAPDK